MNLGNFVGGYLGIKLINGKFRPKFGIVNIIGAILLIVLFALSIIGVGYSIIKFNFELLIICLLGIFSLGYLILINACIQNSNNYYIEFENENTLRNFKLFYKKKQVIIKYVIGSDGRIAFANNANKLSCVSYYDNSKMSNLTKYKIINYFAKWLNDNNLISKDVTTTFEDL